MRFLMRTMPSARARAEARWKVITCRTDIFDIVITIADKYMDRMRCSTQEEAIHYAILLTEGNIHSIADIWSPHLGTIAIISGNRSDLP